MIHLSGINVTPRRGYAFEVGLFNKSQQREVFVHIYLFYQYRKQARVSAEMDGIWTKFPKSVTIVHLLKDEGSRFKYHLCKLNYPPTILGMISHSTTDVLKREKKFNQEKSWYLNAIP